MGKKCKGVYGIYFTSLKCYSRVQLDTHGGISRYSTRFNEIDGRQVSITANVLFVCKLMGL